MVFTVTQNSTNKNPVDFNIMKIEETGEELFNQFLNGDVNAFEKLIDLYEDELSRFIYIRIRNRDEVKNLTIETFGQLAINGRKFSGKSSLKTYIFTIAKNLAHHYLKTQKKNVYASYDEVGDIMCDVEETPHGFMEREENKELLHTAMKKLKKEHREVLEHIYFEDMSYKQAAHVMGKSENQIKQLIYRSKLALQKALDVSTNTLKH